MGSIILLFSSTSRDQSAPILVPQESKKAIITDLMKSCWSQKSVWERGEIRKVAFSIISGVNGGPFAHLHLNIVRKKSLLSGREWSISSIVKLFCFHHCTTSV